MRIGRHLWAAAGSRQPDFEIWIAGEPPHEHREVPVVGFGGSFRFELGCAITGPASSLPTFGAPPHRMPRPAESTCAMCGFLSSFLARVADPAGYS